LAPESSSEYLASGISGANDPGPAGASAYLPLSALSALPPALPPALLLALPEAPGAMDGAGIGAEDAPGAEDALGAAPPPDADEEKPSLASLDSVGAFELQPGVIINAQASKIRMIFLFDMMKHLIFCL
jgi:hypothetical protein